MAMSSGNFWKSVETVFPEHKLTTQQHLALDASVTNSLRGGSAILVVPDAETLPQLWEHPKKLIQYFNDNVASKQTIESVQILSLPTRPPARFPAIVYLLKYKNKTNENVTKCFLFH